MYVLLEADIQYYSTSIAHQLRWGEEKETADLKIWTFLDSYASPSYIQEIIIDLLLNL